MPPSRALPAVMLLSLVLAAMSLPGLDTQEPPLLQEDGGQAHAEPTAAVGEGALLPEAPDAGVLPGLEPPMPVPSREKAPPIAHLRALPPQQDVLARARMNRQGRLVLPGPDGGTVLTVEPLLQRQLTSLLEQYEVPYGAAVVLEPATGKVLAMAEHAAAQPGLRGLPTRAVFPAASIFKLVTGTALLEAGVPPETETCFHGGKRRLTERLLVDGERDGKCQSLAEAMGASANVVFAKLTQRHLTAAALRHAAARLRFNRPISFPVPTELSLALIPEEEFDLASTGAGFGDVYLSPLHGALIAAAVANGGRWQEPRLFEAAAPAPASESVFSPEVAQSLTDMMEETVTQGTARRTFRERCCRVPGAVGKTGTLADRNPFRDYSWFVGFAPKEAPRVAVAAVIVNGPLWRIRATWLGREALRLGLLSLPAPAPAPAPAIAPTVSSAPASPSDASSAALPTEPLLAAPPTQVPLVAPASQAPPGLEAPHQAGRGGGQESSVPLTPEAP